MTPESFDNALRNLVSGLNRRSLLGVLVGAAAASALPGESSGRRFRDPRDRNRKNRKGKDRNRNKDRNNKKKGKKGKKDKNKGRGRSKGCKAKHSEKEILGFIHKAARKYGQSESAMVRVARCESALDPCAFNKSGPYYGLFQFLKSTWKTTPYKDKSIHDPKAQAFAAAWMWNKGRKNEWACK